MKKLRLFLLFALLLTLVLTHSASAEMLTVEADLSYDSPYTYMLRSGDTLHCLTIGGYAETTDDVTVCLNMAQCSMLENGVLMPCEDHCADRFQDRAIHNVADNIHPSHQSIFGIAISAQNQTYLIDGDWAVYQWTPGEADPWHYLCTLDTSLFDFENYVSQKVFVADGDMLYGCFTEVEDYTLKKGTAFSFSLTSGASEKLFSMPYMYAIYLMDENQMLFKGAPDASIRFMSQYLYDFTSQKTTLFISEAVNYLMPDGLGGWYGVAPSNYASYGLYHYSEDGTKGDPIVSLPEAVMQGSMSLSEDKHTLYICGSEGMLVICPLPDGESELPSELVLAGSLNEYNWNGHTLPDISAFSVANNGAQITSVDYPSSFDDLALALVSGSDQFDIMVLELSMGNVDSLLDKGYYVDLSDNNGIASYVQNLYPTWRDKCLRGNEIAGIPISMRNVWTFMVNLELWEEEGLGDYPKTYDELFDCIKEWDSMGVLDEVPLFDNRSSAFDSLFNRIMVDYMGKCKREGRPIVFSDETLLHLLSRLEELRPILQAHDARNITGDGLLFEGIISNVLHITALNKFEVTAENNTFVPLPLGLTSEEDCVESVFFTMLVVNPNSQRQELAKAFLAYLAEHPTTWARCYLLQDGPVGVREKGYEDLDEQYEQLVSELDEKIAAAMKEGDDAVVNRWEQEKKDLTNEYLNMWEVRPNMAEMVYEMMPYLTPLTSDGYGFLNTSCDDLTEMFLEGRLDSRTYAMRLDQRMQMMILEGIK